MTTAQYINYLSVPFQDKALILITMISSILLAFLENQVGISFGILAVYFLLAGLDTVLGIYKNVFKNKQDFKSELFLKKILSVSIIIIALASITQIVKFTEVMVVPVEMVAVFQNTIIYIFNLVKIFLVVAFLSYEITSLRENAVALKWSTLVGALDVFLKPFVWAQDLIQKKITNNESKP